ncbi:MAG: hypothetical protein HY883_04815, partial [Deltaproteobacteria bacterium]|nr:hypothetical protein [Deltaproteobacteria bacterium]
MESTIKPVAASLLPQEALPAPKKENQLVMEIIPCLSPLLSMAWPTIKPLVEELAEKSMGEFTVFDVYKEIYFGSVTLYMGSVVEDKEAYESGEPTKKTFAGYALVRLEKNSAHIWQIYIMPEYRMTNLFEVGCEWVEQEVRKT